MAAIYIPRFPVDIEVTSTIYPVDSMEYVQITVTVLDEGELRDLFIDGVVRSIIPHHGSVATIRFDGPDIEDGGAIRSVMAHGGNVYDVRFDGPDIEDGGAIRSVIPHGGSVVGKKVEIATPDEMLDVACYIVDECSMTDV